MKQYLLVSASTFLAVTALLSSPSRGEGMESTCFPAPETAAVHLPKPRFTSETSVEEAISKRRSVRQFRDEPLTLAEIGQLLWAAQGVTSGRGLRAAPSAGALYPLEVYVVAGRVTDLAAGVYRYLPTSHTMVRVKPADRRGELALAALHQPAIRDAPASLVFSAAFPRTTRKYGERGIRYVHMDLGHAAENVYLQAVSLDLGTVIIGAFEDNAVAKALCLPSTEEPLAIMPVGRTKGDR